MTKLDDTRTDLPNRFRTVYRKLSSEEQVQLAGLKVKAEELAQLIERSRPVPTRYTSLALTNLEQAVMWAVKEVTT